MTVLKQKPSWMKVSIKNTARYDEIKQVMQGLQLHTVCEEAKCPNLYECWANNTATFMILGRVCTRACRFCAVTSGLPTELDLEEPKRVADAVSRMGLSYAVVTSVARDDLSDGGASVFAQTIQEIRRAVPRCKVEVLIPDFKGESEPLETVLAARPDVLNHNIETVRERSDRVRSGARYERSLALLEQSKRIAPSIPTKSSLMVGIGETWAQLLQTMDDLRAVSCDLLTIGQYLQPTEKHEKISHYYTPQQFDELKREALSRGFASVVAGPLVRSSYHAHEQEQQYDVQTIGR